MMRTTILVYGLLAAAAATQAAAQSAPDPAAASREASATEIAGPAADRLAVLPRTPIALEDLAGLNGRQGERISIALTEQDLNAVNHGNTVAAATVGSGQISIGPGAYEGFAGVGNFVINSGHNNNLQGALTINIVTP